MSQETQTTVRYDRSEEDWAAIANDPEKLAQKENWLRKDTVDAWRHRRMRAHVQPLIADDPDAQWLTIGDGRLGTDAQHLMEMGAKDVHCTDISEDILKVAHAKGLIGAFSRENAETLSFSDNSFDYVYCKEALHHFPRPFTALHEMMRVARKAIIITEPRDIYIDTAPLGALITVSKLLRGRWKILHGFEPVGNYLYWVSERELEKFMLGLHQRHIAFKGINDAYFRGVETAALDQHSGPAAALERKVKRRISFLDWLARLGLKQTGLLTAVMFKTAPTNAVTSTLKNDGFRVKVLPENIFLEHP